MSNNDCFRLGPDRGRKAPLTVSATLSPYSARRLDPQPQPELRAALDPLSGFRTGNDNPLATWTAGGVPESGDTLITLRASATDVDPRLSSIIIANAVDGLGAVALAADAALGRKVSIEEIKAASKLIGMSALKAGIVLQASGGRVCG